MLVIRTIINQLGAHERAELSRLVDRFTSEQLTPRDCTASERQIIRAIIKQARLRPRLIQAELDARAAEARRQQQMRVS